MVTSLSEILDEEISDNIFDLSKHEAINKKELSEFFSTFILNSRKNTFVIFLNKIPNIPQFGDIFAYYLKNNKKSLVSLVEKFSLAYEFGLGIDLSLMKNIEDFIDVDSDENNKSYTHLVENFNKIFNSTIEDKNTDKEAKKREKLKIQ